MQRADERRKVCVPARCVFRWEFKPPPNEISNQVVLAAFDKLAFFILPKLACAICSTHTLPMETVLIKLLTKRWKMLTLKEKKKKKKKPHQP